MKLLNNIFLFIFSFVIILIMGEYYITFSGIQDRSNNKFDKNLGRIRRNNYEYVKFNEGFSISKFNKYSYLGPSYNPTKTKGTIRIALIGDSYVEGFQVFEREHFRTIAEKNLNKNSDIKYEILNFGRSGIGLENIYAIDSLMIRKFNPDYTLYFLGSSDFYEKTNDPLIPGVIVKNNCLIINNKFSQNAINTFKKTNPILQKSAFLSMLNNDRKLIKSGSLLFKLLDKFMTLNKITSSPNDLNNLKHEIPLKNKLIIKKISNNSKIIIVNRSDEKFSQNIIDLLDKSHISQIDLSQVLQELIQNGIDPHYWKATNKEGHWNQITHKLIGKYLAKRLKKITENL